VAHRDRSWRSLALLASVVAVLVPAMAACDSSARAIPTSTKPADAASCASRLRPNAASRSDGPAWIVRPGSLQKMQRAGLPKSLVRDFNRPSTLMLVHSGNPAPIAPLASLTYDFTSAVALESALTAHQVPADVPFVLLDLERWPLTPKAEQQQPIENLRQAVRAANAAGKCVVFAPAVDLVGGPSGGSETTQIASFDRLIVAPGASVSDAFDVQSQQTEGTAYADVLAPKAVAAARAAQPREPMFVGLSTNPDGRHVSVADLLKLYQSGVSGGAIGYWLNIPESDTECPKCGPPQTGVGVSFLEALARTSWAG
jgi:hypothetical protein